MIATLFHFKNKVKNDRKIFNKAHNYLGNLRGPFITFLFHGFMWRYAFLY